MYIKTNSNRYLQAKSHHHLAQKVGVIHTVTTREIRISNMDQLGQELDNLIDVFKKNGYDDE